MLLSANAQADLDDLVTLLQVTERSCWVFALYTHASVRDEVKAKLRKHLGRQVPFHEFTLSVKEPDPLTFLDKLDKQKPIKKQKIPKKDSAKVGITAPASIRPVVSLLNLETVGPEAYHALDYQRELIAARGVALVFWVTPAGRIQAARHAPNFWAQRSGVFDFTTPQQTQTFSGEARGMWTGPVVRYEDAADLERQLSLAEQLLNDYGDAPHAPRTELHGKAAYLHFIAGRYTEAEAHLHKQLLSAEEHADTLTQAWVLNNLGQLASQRIGPTEALDYYERAQILARDSSEALGATLLNLTNVLYGFGDYAQAQKTAQDALKIASTANDLSGTAKAHWWLGEIEQRYNNYSTAEQHTQISRQLAETLEDPLLLTKAQISLADLSRLRGDYANAEVIYRKALQINEKLGDRAGIAVLQHNLALLLKVKGDYVAAEALYRASLEISENLGNRCDIATSQHALAELAKIRGDYATAEAPYRASLEIFESLGNRHSVMMCQCSLADLLARRGEYNQAAQLYQAARRLAESLGDKYATATILYDYAYFLMTQGRIDAAREMLKRSQRLFQQVGADDTLVVNALRLLNQPRQLVMAQARHTGYVNAPRLKK